jgi:hypothetical protein
LRHLVVASPDHRDFAEQLQSTIFKFRNKLRESIETAWIDRHVILDGVTESGGMGLGGGEGLEKARDAVKGVVAGWKGVGALVG